MILRERDPVEHFAPLLGPRVGLRARRPVAAAMRVPFTFKMPPSGTILVKVTLAPGAERGGAVRDGRRRVVPDWPKLIDKPVMSRNPEKRRLAAMLNVLAKPRPRPQDMGHPGRAMNGGR